MTPLLGSKPSAIDDALHFTVGAVVLIAFIVILVAAAKIWG